jgi:hypothetical protein
MDKINEDSVSNPFTGFVDQVNDPRSSKHILYPLEEILFLLITATLSGSDELTMTAVFGKINYLGCVNIMLTKTEFPLTIH